MAITTPTNYNDLMKKSRFDDDDGRWITTENGHKVHLNEEGEPDKGNPHVIDKMQKGKETPSGKSKFRGELKSISDRVKSMPHSGADYEQAVQDLMDLSYDNPEDFYEIVDSLDPDTADRLAWEMGPDNTDAINQVIKPAIEAKKTELKGKIPPPAKNKSSSAVINGNKVTFSNVRNASYPNSSRSQRFIDITVEDPDTGERIASHAATDYESAMKVVYRIAGLRTKSYIGR